MGLRKPMVHGRLHAVVAPSPYWSAVRIFGAPVMEPQGKRHERFQQRNLSALNRLLIVKSSAERSNTAPLDTKQLPLLTSHFKYEEVHIVHPKRVPIIYISRAFWDPVPTNWPASSLLDQSLPLSRSLHWSRCQLTVHLLNKRALGSWKSLPSRHVQLSIVTRYSCSTTT